MNDVYNYLTGQPLQKPLINNPFPAQTYTNAPFVAAPFVAAPFVAAPFTAQPAAPQLRTAGLTPDQMTGIADVRNAAADTAGLAASGNDLALATLGGQYLNPSTNPYLKATSDAANRQTINQYDYATRPGIAGAFAQGGSLGSSAYNSAQDQARFNLAGALADSNAQIYGSNYQNERANQLNVLNNEGALMQDNFIPGSALIDAGTLEQQNLQNQYNTAYQNQYNAGNVNYLNALGLADTNYQNQVGNANINYQNQAGNADVNYQNQAGNANVNYQNQAGQAQTAYQNAYQNAAWPFTALDMLGAALGETGPWFSQGTATQTAPMGGKGF